MIRVHLGHQVPDGLPSPDTYFLPGYGRAASIADPGEWVLLEALDGAWQVPLILRTLNDGTKDAISPYGYSGVYASPALTSIQIQEAWSATINCLRQLSVISVLLRHSPLVPQAPHVPGQHSIISGHPTMALGLTDNETAWSGMEGRCRTSIRKALKNGYTAEVRQATSLDLAPAGNFRRLYEETMTRRAASALYFFGDAYYRELLDGLGSNLLIAAVRDREGAAVSATLLMRHTQRLHYHLSGSSVDHARMGSNNLMLWTATQFGIAQGLRLFHLGGGVGPRDDLFMFKRSFGGTELKYGVSGLIIDQDLYQAYARIRAKACAITADSLMASNYFPAYRGGTTRV
jgi:lipid II:glycine glycyltransferase (peptidoglycan interpeptide bridge formation enzyme)